MQKTKKGLLLMILCAVGFIFFFWYFNLSGVSLDNRNIFLSLKMIFTSAFIPAGLYLGLYFSHSKKLANQIGGGGAIFLVISFILGFLLH